MKVGDITPHIPRRHGQGPSAKESDTSAFQQVLDDALRPGGPTKTPPLGGVQAHPFPITGPEGVQACEEERAGIAVMERFVEALEGYRQGLADPQRRLRDIAPALERLEAAHQHLSHLAASETVATPLRDIMNEGLVTAAMEIRRFHGGLYC